MTRPIIGFIGDTVVLQCRTNGSALMSWTHGGKSIATTRGVFHVNPRLSVNNSTEGQLDLMINSTQQDDAGRYTCFVFGAIVKAELIVLGKYFVLKCYCVNSVSVHHLLVSVSLQLI